MKTKLAILAFLHCKVKVHLRDSHIFSGRIRKTDTKDVWEVYSVWRDTWLGVNVIHAEGIVMLHEVTNVGLIWGNIYIR